MIPEIIYKLIGTKLMVSFDSLHEKIDAEKKVRFLLAKGVPICYINAYM